MSYSHLTITDRIKIETYLDLGLKSCQIASKLDFHKSTISRELRWCQNGYYAVLAQEQYDHRAKQKGRKSCLTPKLKKEIEKGLKASWSPEQICGRYQLEQKPMVAFKTIYNWLYAGLIDLDLSVLRRKGKSRQPKETRGAFRIGTSIAKRPKEVRNRETFGHWELDTVVSSRGKSKGCLATFLERKTRFYLAFKIPDRTAQAMFSAIEQLCRLFPKEALKTFTSDRGKRVCLLSSGGELRNSLFLCGRLFFLAERKQWKRKWLTKRIFPKENRFSRYLWWGFEQGFIWYQSPTTKMFSLQNCLWSSRGWVQVNVALILAIYHIKKTLKIIDFKKIVFVRLIYLHVKHYKKRVGQKSVIR